MSFSFLAILIAISIIRHSFAINSSQ